MHSPHVQPAPPRPAGDRPSVHMWQNLMCLTYLMHFKRMEDFFQANGCRVLDGPEGADWILIGACGAFYGQIDDFFDRLAAFSVSDSRLAVFGCVPKVSPDRYRQVQDRVELTIDTKHPQWVERMLDRPEVRWADLPEPNGFRAVDYRHFDPAKRYVIVQHGCNAKCVFCPHILGIGHQESVPADQVLANVRREIATGGKLLMLEGRDLGSWGTDLDPPAALPDLLDQILALDGDFRVMVNQLGANWVIRHQERLLETLKDPRIIDVHIPVQTSSDRLLRLMGREPGVATLAQFLSVLRRRRCRPVLRTDMLIGFPTETEEELEATLEFVKTHFDEVAYYGFELHPNTKVAGMGLPFFSQEEIERRVRRAADAIASHPNLVWHRGGQVPATMLDREKQKLRLKRA